MPEAPLSKKNTALNGISAQELWDR
jgi:hypothetical protein